MANRRRRRLCAVATLALGTAGSAQAQDDRDTQASPSLTANLTLASDYRFRGISQTFAEGTDLGPAVQGGLDFTHSSGWYVGNWNSNVSGNQYPNGASLEMDFYGGLKHRFGPLGIDLGTVYYHYPGARFSGLTATGGDTPTVPIRNWELYAGASWSWLSVKYSYALTNYFGTTEDVAISLDNPDDPEGPLARHGGTRGTQYLSASLSLPLADKLTASAGVGVTWLSGYPALDYTDYHLGLSYDLRGWLLGAALVGTNADENFYYATNGAGRVKALGERGFVLTVGKAF